MCSYIIPYNYLTLVLLFSLLTKAIYEMNKAFILILPICGHLSCRRPY